MSTTILRFDNSITNLTRQKIEIEYSIKKFLFHLNVENTSFILDFLGNKKYDMTFKQENSYKVSFENKIPINCKEDKVVKLRYCESYVQLKNIKKYYENNIKYSITQPKVLFIYKNILITEWIKEEKCHWQNREDCLYKFGMYHGLIESKAIISDKDPHLMLRRLINKYNNEMVKANKYFPFHQIINDNEIIKINNKLEKFKDIDLKFKLCTFSWKKEDLIFDEKSNLNFVDEESITFNLEGFALWNFMNTNIFTSSEEKSVYEKGLNLHFPHFQEVFKKSEGLYKIINILHHGALIHNFVKTAILINNTEEWNFVYRELLDKHRVWLKSLIYDEL